MILKKQQILLYKRGNTTHFPDYYSVVSGNVEKNETFEAAIIRETNEEIGIKIDEQNLKVAHIMHRIDEHDESLYVFFIAESWLGEIKNKEPDKCIELKWTSLNDIPTFTIPYVKEAIAHIKSNNTFSEYKWQSK